MDNQIEKEEQQILHKLLNNNYTGSKITSTLDFLSMHQRGIVESESLRAQLRELNERSRRYSGQLWQVPFAFLGIVGLVIGNIVDRDRTIIGLTLLVLGSLGIAVIFHIRGMADGHRRAVLNLQRVEKQLHLEQTVIYKPGYWRALYLVVIFITVVIFVLGIYFLAY